MAHTLSVTTPSDTEVTMARTFDAPRELLWDCWTKPELLARWMTGPDGWAFAVCDIDLRVGGAYRFVWRSDAGEEIGMTGVYQEVARPERVVHSERYEQDPTGGEALVTLTFAESGGTTATTTVTTTMRFASRDVRDMVVATGMEHGVAAGYDRLEAQLAQLAQQV